MQPPPPRLSASAFAAASAAARLLPHSNRHPTVHLAVVLGPAPVPLLRHAHSLLICLSQKGIHVFLQTEVNVSPPPNIAPVTQSAIPDLVANSPADFFLVVADRNLSAASVQVRFPNASEFVDVYASDLIEAIFAAWTTFLRAHPDPHSHPHLPANPNILTPSHVDYLLQAFSQFPNFRRAYQSLLRAVALTNDWPTVPEITSVQFTAQFPSPAQPLTILSSHPQNHSSTSSASPENIRPSQPVTNPQITHPPPQTPSQQRDHQPPSSGLIDQALRHGLRAIFRLRTREPSTLRPLKTSPNSQLSFCWLRNSPNTAARLLRSQLLAVSLHRNLISTFDTIATAPLTPASSSRDPSRLRTLPTDAHRYRLLREVNELIPRVEELGRRLAKRPSIKRRRKKIIQSNPWNGYIYHALNLAVDGKGGRKEIATCTTQAAIAADDSVWRCCVCHSYRDRRGTDCPACRTRAYDPDMQFFLENPNMLRKKFQETLNSRQGAPTPWIFAPGVLPIQPLVNNGFPNGALHTDQTINSRSRSPPSEKTRHYTGQNIRSVPNTFHDGGAVASHPSYDLAGSMNALSMDERHLQHNPSSVRAEQTQSDHIYAQGQPPFLRSNNSIPTRPSQLPMRLATSAPNGPSLLEYDFSNRPPNGGPHAQTLEAHPGQAGQILSQISRSSPPRKSLMDDMRTRSRPPGTLHGESLPSVEAFTSNVLFDINSSLERVGDMFQNSRPNEVVGHVSDSLKSLQSQGDAHTNSTSGFHHASLEELAVGSYEADEKGQRFLNATRRTVSQPIAVPRAFPKSETGHIEIDSLQALAAASDAANGGTGSATMESLRAVSAVVTSGRGHSGTSSSPPTDGMYNMF